MQLWLDLTVIALTVAAVYAVVGLGVALAFGVMQVPNFAHGAFVAAGMYATVWLSTSADLEPALVAPLAAVAVGLVGVVAGFLITALDDREAQLLLAIGVGFSVLGGLQVIFGPHPESAKSSWSKAAFGIGEVSVSWAQVAMGGVAALVMFGLAAGAGTRFGRRVRAAAADWQLSELSGIRSRAVKVQIYAISAGLAGLAGALLVAAGRSATLGAGTYWTLKAFLVVLLGGVGSIPAALGGAAVLAGSEVVGGHVYGAEYGEPIGLALFVLVIAVRPQGLFGRLRTRV